MEHRYKKRFQFSLDVTVRGGDGSILYGRSCDISSEGMFIELNESVPIHTAVDVECSSCGYLPALVVHSGDRGIGVMFRATSLDEKEFLDQLLSGTLVEQVEHHSGRS
ncbi:MAG: PilZ domain-containing protein [Gammaproteobacteria bacterium]|nr:PilZ domain-containing protein [Gammaproteobacteria bacterium]MCF6231418.1 PilZ domain-containing protein [Gammaproteobacteria bacterium]